MSTRNSVQTDYIQGPMYSLVNFNDAPISIIQITFQFHLN